MIEYKFDEDQLIREFETYIDNTYNSHYSKTKFQAAEFIFDSGHGEGFCIGNAMKYLQRYGRKSGYNRMDLMKVLHYVIMMLYLHDMREGKGK